MRLDLTFPELGRLVTRMGAASSHWTPNNKPLDALELLRAELAEGKEIPLSEVEVSFGGLLTYQGEQVVLYIKDTRQERSTLLHDREEARRFHIAECRTLDRMRREGRFERYVVTTRRDGLFLVEATDPMSGSVEELEARLGVCRNCLAELDWKRYGDLNSNEKKHIWNEFSLDDFFAEFATFFRSNPVYSDETAPRGGYAKNWSRISERIRAERNWQCEECGVDLSDHRHLLHCHHKNGVVSDNNSANIAVLCLLCHSEQPAHNYLKPNPKYRLLIEHLRAQQMAGD